MSATRVIEIDTATADELEARAAMRGMSVGQMVAELVAQDTVRPSDIQELDRQWVEIEAGAPTVPHEKVARWLETWGTPAFKPWHEQ